MQRTRRVAPLFGILMTVCVLIWFNPPTAPRPISAQAASCPEFVSKAMTTASQLCDSATKRNQACYGNTLASAQARPGTTIKFTTPGDIVELADLQTMTLTGYDSSAGTWGIAMMRVQADLPDTGVGQNVTILVFGDTEIQNASSDRPMQAFYFRTGMGAPGCHQMPQDGVLLKTPSGGRKVQLVANGVQLNIGSTVFLQARSSRPLPTGPRSATLVTPSSTTGAPTGQLVVHTIKGSVDVTANGRTQIVNEGMQNTVELNDNLEPVGEPATPEANEVTFDDDTIKVLDDVDVPGEATAEPEAVGTATEEIGTGEPATLEPTEEATVDPGVLPTGEAGGEATIAPGDQPTVEPGPEQPTTEPGGDSGGTGGTDGGADGGSGS
jgi:hypothetical protein